MIIPDKEELRVIRSIIQPYIFETPVMNSNGLNSISGAELYFKCENFQKTGSFKIRGAMNAVFSIPENELDKGVITHSSGNFAQALAYAAKCRGAKAQIVMPRSVSRVKRDAVLGYGAKIIYSGDRPADREKKCNEVIARTGAAFVHPSNDPNVFKGHASCALELIDFVPGLDYVFAPVGGGGLISGIALGFRAYSRKTIIIGGEPKNADDAYRSIKAHKIILSVRPRTIADGLKTSLGTNTFPVIEKNVDFIERVTEKEIVNAMRLIWERMKIVVEPSGAVSFAAALKLKKELEGKKVGIIISGGNVDLEKLPF